MHQKEDMVLDDLSNEELVQLFDRLVRYDHYDPVETPADIVSMRDEGISHYVLRDAVLARMIDRPQ